MTPACRALGALRPAARLLTGSAYLVLGYRALQEPGSSRSSFTRTSP